MKTKIISLASISIISLFLFQESAYSSEQAKKIKDSKMIMSELLNSGWTITSHTSQRYGTGIDDRWHISFLLLKNKKYVFCNNGDSQVKVTCINLN